MSARSGTTKDTLEESSGTEVLEVAEPGVGDDDEPGRERMGEGVDRRHERRQLALGALMGAEVERDPRCRGGLQGLHLPLDGPVRRPALLNDPGVLVVAGEAHRCEVEVQAAGVDAEPLEGGEQEPGAQVLAVGGDGIEATAETVVVQKPGRDFEQLGDRGRGGPGGDVVEGGGATEPVGDEDGDHLAVGEK